MNFFKRCCFCYSAKRNEEPNGIEVKSENQNSAPVLIPVQEPLKIIVDTKFRTEDVKLSEFTPANTQIGNFAYNCPICLRYFSTILVLNCCKQYICHFCIQDLGKDVKFDVACPICKTTPIFASDVDLGSTVKRYSDSPYGTLKQSQNHGNKWVPMNVVHEANEYEESQFPESANRSVKQPNEIRLHLTA